MSIALTKTRRSKPRNGEPTWEIAQFFPPQGSWTEEKFFEVEDLLLHKGWVELVNGCLEILPMPTEVHQLIVGYYYKALDAFTRAHAPGLVMPPGIKIRIRTRGKPTFRQPDVAYVSKKNYHLRGNRYWKGADLAMEVVSDDPKDRERDLIDKVRDYAVARIPEYWIIDPLARLVRVYALKGSSYRLHGEFGPGEQATSLLLRGFVLSVDVLLGGGED